MRSVQDANTLLARVKSQIALPALLFAIFHLPFGPSGCTRTPPAGGPLAYSTCFGEVGMSPGQFSYPRGMDHDDTTIWVVDKAARVQRIDPKTGDSLSGWRMPDWKLGKPTGITVWKPKGGGGGGTDADERIFVADTHYHRVMIYAFGKAALQPGEKDPGNDGTAWGAPVRLVGQFGGYGTRAGQFTYPTDIAVLPTRDGKSIKRLYVSEYGGCDRVSVYEPSGPDAYECKFTFGRFGSGGGAEPVEFSRPQSIAIDADRNELIVADACNHRLGRFTTEGRLVKWISSPDLAGSPPGQFMYPYGLSLIGDGTAMVAEFGNNRVQHIDLDSGESLGIYGQQGRGDGQLATPWAVTVQGETMYVLDSGNNRVMGVMGVATPRVGRARAAAFNPAVAAAKGAS